MMDLRDVAFCVVRDYPGGASSLGPRIDKPASTLSGEVNGSPGAKLGLETAERITIKTGDLRILQAFASNCGQMLVPLPSVASGDNAMVRLAASAKEFGDLVAEVSADLADGRISDNELARIDRETGELIASVHALREALAKRNAEQRRPDLRAA